MPDREHARHQRLLAVHGDKPLWAFCPICFDCALELKACRRSWQIRCRSCGSNGFLRAVEHLWPVLGLSQSIRRLEWPENRRHRSDLRGTGHRALARESWADAQLGRGPDSRRSVMETCVSCLGCGDDRAMLVMDITDRPYVTHRACGCRVHLPDMEAADVYVGISELMSSVPQAHWLAWWGAGRPIWMAWNKPSEDEADPLGIGIEAPQKARQPMETA